MKKIFITFLSIIGLLTMYSCSYTELMDYEGKEGVYFFVQRMPVSGYGDTTVWNANSSTTIEFTKIPYTDTTLHLRVMTTGPVKSYDRPFNIVINKDSTTAIENTNYVFDSSSNVVKAGMHYSDVKIRIIRSEELTTKTLRAMLELKPNEHFDLSPNALYSFPGSLLMDKKDEGHNPAYHSIFMNYFLVRPVAWVPAMDYAQGSAELGLLGQFSEKKFNLLSQLANVTYDEFTDKTTMPQVRITVLGQLMGAYLINQYNNKTPVLEDDGRLMWVMGVPWTSYIGVPYVPVNN